jgi:cytochrome c-type biogenesis protein CcmH
MKAFRYLNCISLCMLFILGVAPGSIAQVDTFEFENDVQQQRFRTLSDELRCPMCQNTNLSGSTGGVAEDLRREIHRMILDGMSDRDIERFMFERYGDFIFYRPRLTAQTLLLWFGPLFFLLIGGFVARGVFKRAKEVGDIESELDESQKARLEELIGDQ